VTAQDEFDLIRELLAVLPPGGDDVVVGLAPRLLGHRALAVNLSDLAAMGATPHGFLLALTAPDLAADWLRDLARGLLDCAGDSGARLVGGNLARGPLALTVTVTGTVPAGTALLRTSARPGDLLYVSGRIGAGAAGLAALDGRDPARLDADALDEVLRPYLTPVPRLALGRALRAVASAGIDVSDGLIADVGHLAVASGLQARVVLERVPVVGDDPLRAVAAGDDYELVFALPPSAEAQVDALAEAGEVSLTRIGRLVEPASPDAAPVVLLDGDGEVLDVAVPGWDHFR
jgi:thiamine-monophosphate kinase